MTEGRERTEGRIIILQKDLLFSEIFLYLFIVSCIDTVLAAENYSSEVYD